MATQKTSIAIGKQELAAARKAAASEGLSLSAFLTKLVRAHVAQEATFEAMDLYVKKYVPGFQLTEEARSAIEAEWNAPLEPVRKKRRRGAA